MILFQSKDKKFQYWRDALAKYTVECNGVSGSPIKIPLVLLKLIVKRKRPHVFVFRYLNDYPGLLKTILRLVSDLTSIWLCSVFGIKIWWILHNIDKETHEHHSKITKIRRKYLAKRADVIFVTDYVLIPKAKETYPNHNVDAISLGYIESNVYSLAEDVTLNNKIESWLKTVKQNQSKIIFVIGTNANKVLHFKRINNFIAQMNEMDHENNWYALVIGGKTEDHENIFNINSNYSISEELIMKYCDYYYRVIDDFSISYTVYEACTYRIPLITENIGALPMIVEYYKLGFVLNNENFSDLLAQVEQSKEFGFDFFLSTNNWENAAAKFKQYLND